MLRRTIFSALLIFLRYECINNDTNWRTIPEIYSQSWMVRITNGMDTAMKIAQKEGFASVEEIGNLDHLYHFFNPKFDKDVLKEHITAKLNDYDEVSWAEPVTIISKSNTNDNRTRYRTLTKSSIESSPTSISQFSTEPDTKTLLRSLRKSSLEPDKRDLLSPSDKSSPQFNTKRSPKRLLSISTTETDIRESLSSLDKPSPTSSLPSIKSSLELDTNKSLLLSGKASPQPGLEKSPSLLDKSEPQPNKKIIPSLFDEVNSKLESEKTPTNLLSEPSSKSDTEVEPEPKKSLSSSYRATSKPNLKKLRSRSLTKSSLEQDTEKLVSSLGKFSLQSDQKKSPLSLGKSSPKPDPEIPLSSDESLSQPNKKKLQSSSDRPSSKLGPTKSLKRSSSKPSSEPEANPKPKPKLKPKTVPSPDRSVSKLTQYESLGKSLNTSELKKKKSPSQSKSLPQPDLKKSLLPTGGPSPKPTLSKSLSRSPRNLSQEPNLSKSPSGSKSIEKKPFINVYCAGPENTVISTSKSLLCNDPIFPKQWFMRSCDLQLGEKKSTYDIKLIPTWKKYNVYGRGVKVIVGDDGIFNHSDLRNNFSLEYSTDLIHRKNDPTPFNAQHSHGTKCAGIIGMERNNGICGVGIAPEATIGGVRMQQHGQFVDMHQAEAFAFKAEEIDIFLHAYSYIDGETIAHLNPATYFAIHKGITDGRRGKGILYVFPAGNGKENQDLCSCDSLLSLMYTIVIAGVKHDGKAIEYSERCANIMVTMYSGSCEKDYNIPTIDTTGSETCDENFCGTSASSPMAAGALALLLEANPNINWREVQYILAWTSRFDPLSNNPGWYKNAAGFYVSLDFGFGLMDIFEMVKLAKEFKSIPAMNSCTVEFKFLSSEGIIERFKPVRISFQTNGCEGTPKEVKYLEHVEVEIDLTYSVRGDLEIALTSPSGTEVILLGRRPKDKSPYGMKKYVFDSVHTWGEQPQGQWHLDIIDYNGSQYNRGAIHSAAVVFHGTKEKPYLYENGPRKYQ